MCYNSFKEAVRGAAAFQKVTFWGFFHELKKAI